MRYISTFFAFLPRPVFLIEQRAFRIACKSSVNSSSESNAAQKADNSLEFCTKFLRKK